MNTVVICSPYIKKILPNGYLDKFEIDGESITMGLFDVPEPNYERIFDSHSILVRITAFSCNFRDRSLLHRFHEQCKLRSKDNQIYYSPIGSEFVGVVEKVGSAVIDFKAGDRVMPNHSYPFKHDGQYGGVITNFASQRLQMFNEAELIRVPDKMSDEEAAAFSLSAQTAYSMVRKAMIKKGDNILITSLSSSTSLAVLDALNNIGAKVYASSTHAETFKSLVEEQKLCGVFSLRDLKDGRQKIPLLDVVIDPFIDINLRNLFQYLNYNARYVFCGTYKQSEKFDYKTYTSIDVMAIYDLCIIKNVSFIGNCLGFPTDLANAINDYCQDNYHVHIDSIFSGKNIIEFFTRTFKKRHIGKVIYKYQ